MYVGFDDTDSTSSMCTTFLATELLRALPDLDLIGLPRLVRLNPAVPWKTRGNGALCLRLGKGAGNGSLVGRIGERPVLSFPRSRAPGDEETALAACSHLLRRWSRTDEGASPGLVLSRRPPSPRLYWEAVRRVVEKVEVAQELGACGARTFELAGGRGIIGAAAAMSWRPRDRTYEVLVYRSRERWGTPRQVSAQDVARLDSLYPSTFNNFDHEAGRTAIVPHSPCPILFGIRGDDPGDLLGAMASVRSEEKDRWLLFVSNQGTDDHIIRRWRALEPWSSYRVRGTVAGAPRTFPGGHVIIRLRLAAGQELDCAAYEPSKGFRAVVRRLVPGDEVAALGELRDSPRTLNLEKLQVLALAPARRKLGNPLCPSCGKSMQSIGRGAGYRCRRCGARSYKQARSVPVRRTLSLGWYEPPVCSRRHISMPIKRMPSY